MILPSKEFLEVLKKTNGALSVTEAIAIIQIAAEAPQGIYSEFGVAYGKSSLSAIQSLKMGKFYLVDPIFESEQIRFDVFDRLRNNIAGIELINGYSTDEIQKHENYSYVFVDSGSHQDGLPMQEVKLLEDRIVQGGIIAFHDWNSQFKEVKEAGDYLVSTGKYEYIPIDWDEIINYVNENNLEANNSSWHHPELKNPCFIGALKRV
jgi:predicted O-methyltransferase YrrM